MLVARSGTTRSARRRVRSRHALRRRFACAPSPWKFVSWATSKEYIRLVGERLGWARVPPGSRLSTYKLDKYVKASSGSAQATIGALRTIDPNRPTVKPVPYKGIQYVGIPEFQDLGTKVSQEFAAVLAGNQSVDAALRKAQEEAQAVADDGYKD
jgi:sorbitol/mannitol transport system substrate-binding protein